MKKIILLLLVFILTSCNNSFNIYIDENGNINDLNNEVIENINTNILGLGFNGFGNVDIYYNDGNIDKLINYISMPNLSGLNIGSNISISDTNNIIKLLNNNIKTENLSLTLDITKFNKNIFLLLDNEKIDRINYLFYIKSCKDGIKDIAVSKELGDIFLNKKNKKLDLDIICHDDVMKIGHFIFDNKKQLDKVILNNSIHIEGEYINNNKTTKSIELHIDDEIKKEKVIEELKEHKELIKRVELKIDYELYYSTYLDELLKYYKGSSFSFIIEGVQNYEIPYLTYSNIESFKKLENKSYLYYGYNIITEFSDQIGYINEMNKIDLEKYNSIILKYKKLKEDSFKELSGIIENSGMKTDIFFLYGYPIRVK